MKKPSSKNFGDRYRTATEASMREHSVKVGEILSSWNLLHMMFLNIFCYLVDDENFQSGKSIWFCIQSDKTQREMLKALSLAKIEKQRGVKNGIVWVCACCEKLSRYRNSYAHTPVSVDLMNYETVAKPIAYASKDSHIMFIADMSDPKKYQTFLKDMSLLQIYTTSLYFTLIDPEKWPLRRRPALKLIPAKKRTSAHKRNRLKPSKPPRQP